MDAAGPSLQAPASKVVKRNEGRDGRLLRNARTRRPTEIKGVQSVYVMCYIFLSGERPVNRKIPCKFVRNRYISILRNALLKTTHAVYTMQIRSYTNRLVNQVRLLGETETQLEIILQNLPDFC